MLNIALCLNFCLLLWITFPSVAFAVHFPQSGILLQTLKPKETFYFVNLLFAGSTIKIRTRFPESCETVIPYVTLKWKIEGSTCFQRFGRLSLNPLDEKILHFSNVKTSNFGITNYNNTREGERIQCGQENRLQFQRAWESFDVFGKVAKEDKTSISMSHQAQYSNSSNGELVAITPVDGFYLMSISIEHHNIDSKLDVTLDIEGPLGYLSKLEAPILYIHFTMQVLYLTSLLLFMLPYLFRRRNQIPVLHIWLTVLICVEFIGNTISSVNYSRLNDSGTRNFSLDVGSMIFGCMAEAILRSVLLLLCSGLGEVSQQAVKLPMSILLGTLYFVTAIMYESFCLEETKPYVIEAFLMLTCVNEAVIFFYGCKFLLRTRENLKLQTVYTKEGMFFSFLTLLKVSAALMASLMLAIIWSSFSTFCSLGWFLSWFRVAFWSFLRFILLVAVAIIYKGRIRGEILSQAPFFK